MMYYCYFLPNSPQASQTMFAPETHTGTTDAQYTFGINGSLRKREVQAQASNTEYYLFNSAANMKAYSNNGLDFAYYGYNAANTRAYKLSMLNQNQWVNGQPEPLNLQLQSAMFYPNAYINFNQNGEYTKHYYNGLERIASRLGENTLNLTTVTNSRLSYRTMQVDQQARADLLEVVEAGDVPIETPSVDVSTLQTTGSTTDIYYYHTNHLGSTAFVTDQSQNVTQGFLYAPFGEITTEFNATFGNNVLPKYSFNAKELDEETGMYYYEARYYKPPVFTSRDAMFEKKPFISPYTYCRNNPIKYIDPDGNWEWDNDGNLIAQKGDNAWNMASFLGTSVSNSLTILKRCGYSVNSRGILNLKIGDKLSKDNLWVDSEKNNGYKTVENTAEATWHYYTGKGKPVNIGNKTTNELFESDVFKDNHNKITNGDNVETPFSVNMTSKTFHIGNTRVNYSVNKGKNACSVTYEAFFNDGFWDPDFIDEKTLGKMYVSSCMPDGKGPNLERGGVPYDYIPRQRTYFFKPISK